MNKFTTTLNRIDEVKNFCRCALNCKGPVYVKQDKFIIDGKSLMGMFSLDLSKDFKVELTNEEDIKNFLDFVNISES